MIFLSVTCYAIKPVYVYGQSITQYVKNNRTVNNTTLINTKQYVFDQMIIHSCFLTIITIVLALIYVNIKNKSMKKQIEDSHVELSKTFDELSASEEELRAQYVTIQEHLKEIELLNHKYSVAVEGTESAVWELDLTSHTFQVSNSFLKSLNASIHSTEDISKILHIFFRNNEEIGLINEFNNYMEGKIDKINIQVKIYDENNNRRWVLIRGRGVRDSKGELNIIHGIMLEVTKLKEQEEYIEYLAQHDYLTNLPNRSNFMDKLSADIKQKRRGAILLLDIDNFKGINDTLGHMYGDQMLKETANRLLTLVDERCFVSRFGGDEFLILISGNKEDNFVESYLKTLNELLRKPFILKENEYYIQFSIGITFYPEDSNDIDQLLINADTAMYHVKKNGKNNYLYYNKNMLEELKDKVEIVHILRSALKENGFVLAYQPQVNVNTGEIEGYEALLRLKHHKISPAVFIKVAEETGLIIDIGRWVTKEAIRQLVSWKDKGIELKPISINYSSIQINDKEYYSFLVNSIREADLDPSLLELEITESVFMEQTDETLDFLRKIKKLGLRIALDDFGTGYSSLNYLTVLPVDKVKLDKSLCERFLQLENINVLDSLIALVHSLSLVITAEGIEEEEQYKRLKAGGCDFIQGYYFSKPLFESELDSVIGNNFLERVHK